MPAYFTIILLIAAGWGLARARIFPSGTPEVLNKVVLYLCLPALILIHVPTLEASWALLPLVLIPWLLLGSTIALILPLARRLELSREVTATLLVLIPLGNTSFLGFPLVEALLGPEYIRLAVVYDQFGSFLIVCTHVLFVVGWYGDGDNPSAGSMLRQVVSFPPFIALLAALALGNAWYPEWLMALVERFADMLLPLVTLAVGMSLKLRLVPDYRAALLIGLTGKLLVLPALALLLAVWLEAGRDVAIVAVLESAMPPMITAAALLANARLAAPLGSALVAWGVLVSALTVPAWLWVSGLVFQAG
ncbi:MAG: AEC family transporter [Gammaproteobacteria bacterium]|jgi:predicted permease|nr:AEC family transporter [Gammaproteobacteria bacterium]